MARATEGPRFEPIIDSRPDDRPWPTLDWPVAPNTALVGSTVRLDALAPDTDATDLFTALDHPEVWAHLPIHPRTVTDYRAFLEDRVAQPDWQVWTVRLVRPLAGLPAGSIVGTTAYLDARVGDAAIEIGATAYRPSLWGGVVNAECKSLLLAHAFEVLHAGRVQIKTDVRNGRSQQAIARLGAQFEGVLRRHYRRSDGTVRDTVMFSITAEDWPRVRDRLQARIADSDEP